MAHDLRYALRTNLAHLWASAAIVVTLALGIGLTTLVFTLANAGLVKPVPVPGGARLVSIINRSLFEGDRNLPISYLDFQDYRAQATTLESFEATEDEAGILSESGNPPQQYRLVRATSGIFSIVQTKALLGRAFLPSDDHSGAAPILVLGYNVWQERYGGVPGVIGRQVRVNGQPATIVGVMPKWFRFPNNIDLWMPLVPSPDLVKHANRTLRRCPIHAPGAGVRAR